MRSEWCHIDNVRPLERSVLGISDVVSYSACANPLFEPLLNNRTLLMRHVSFEIAWFDAIFSHSSLAPPMLLWALWGYPKAQFCTQPGTNQNTGYRAQPRRKYPFFDLISPLLCYCSDCQQNYILFGVFGTDPCSRAGVITHFTA